MKPRGLTAVAALLSIAFLAAPWPAGGGPGIGPTHDAVPVFTDVAAAAGFTGVAGNFFSWGDYNGDGLDDLLVDGSRLFRNNGPPGWTFTEVTATAFPGGSARGWNGAWADYNNDGWLDLYVGANPSFATNPDCTRSIAAVTWDTLWRNNGDGTFTNVTVAAGRIYDMDPTGVVAWGDYDRDGFVDLYVAGTEDWYTCNSWNYIIWFTDHLYHNERNGTFREVTATAGMTEEIIDPKYGRSAAWGDYNNDGWPDLYVGNYRQLPNYLWRNNGDGTFTDVAPTLQVDNSPPDPVNNPDPCRRAGHTVGAAWADMDNDGDWDLAVGTLNHKDWRTSDDSALYNNSGAAGGYTFANVRGSAGIHVKPYELRTGCSGSGIWTGPEGDELIVGVSWADIDNDGYEDLWFPQIYADISYAYSYLYQNRGAAAPANFTEVGATAGTRVWDTYGGAWSDYDQDGDMDLVTGGRDGGTSSFPPRVHLFRNGAVAGHHWLEVGLQSCTSNSAAIGATVVVEANGTRRMRQVEGGMGAHSQQNSFVQHFGLGDYGGTANVTVIWPDGSSDGLLDVTADQRISMVQHGCTPHPPRSEQAGLSGSDVVITWKPPVTVANLAHYSIYGSTTYDPTNNSYRFLAEVPRWQTSWTHVGQGRGSPSKWFYVVVANTTEGPTERSGQLGKVVIPLIAGVNLISLPLEWPDGNPAIAFSGTEVEAAWSYDTASGMWSSWIGPRPENSLVVGPERGLWVRSTVRVDFALAGSIAGPVVVLLRPGWNLIGIPRLTGPLLVSTLRVAGVGTILGFDFTAPPGYTRPLMDSDTLPGGSGAWVWARSSLMITIQR